MHLLATQDKKGCVLKEAWLPHAAGAVVAAAGPPCAAHTAGSIRGWSTAEHVREPLEAAIQAGDRESATQPGQRCKGQIKPKPAPGLYHVC